MSVQRGAKLLNKNIMFIFFKKPNRPKITTVDEVVFDSLLRKISQVENLSESLVVPVTMFEQYFQGLIFDIAIKQFKLNGEVYSNFIRDLVFSYNDSGTILASTKDIDEKMVSEILSVLSKDSILCDMITHTSNMISIIHILDSGEDEKEETTINLARQRHFLIQHDIYNRSIDNVDFENYFFMIKDYFRKFSPESIHWQ